MAKVTYTDANGVERYLKTGRNVKAIRASRERWRTANLAKQNERNTQWRKNNPAKQSASEKRWRKSNPDAVKARCSRHKFKRRTLVKQHETDVVGKDFLIEQRAAQLDTCAYCTASLNGGGELDHVTPVTKGGKHVKDNLVWACTPCNRKKSDKLGWVVLSPAKGLLANVHR